MNGKSMSFWLLGWLLWSVGALAHGPTPQKSDHKIRIQAPFERAWKAVADPEAICRWHPLVARCEYREADKVRTFELKNGESFEEMILEVNDANHTVYLRQGEPNVKALPVSSYSTRIQVEDNGDGSVTVRWRGRYYRGDTSNFPPEPLNDEAAVKAMDRWIQTGLEGLKGSLQP